jgi:hypothetical protein
MVGDAGVAVVAGQALEAAAEVGGLEAAAEEDPPGALELGGRDVVAADGAGLAGEQVGAQQRAEVVEEEGAGEEVGHAPIRHGLRGQVVWGRGRGCGSARSGVSAAGPGWPWQAGEAGLAEPRDAQVVEQEGVPVALVARAAGEGLGDEAAAGQAGGVELADHGGEHVELAHAERAAALDQAQGAEGEGLVAAGAGGGLGALRGEREARGGSSGVGSPKGARSSLQAVSATRRLALRTGEVWLARQVGWLATGSMRLSRQVGWRVRWVVTASTPRSSPRRRSRALRVSVPPPTASPGRSRRGRRGRCRARAAGAMRSSAGLAWSVAWPLTGSIAPTTAGAVIGPPISTVT